MYLQAIGLSRVIRFSLNVPTHMYTVYLYDSLYTYVYDYSKVSIVKLDKVSIHVWHFDSYTTRYIIIIFR